MKNNKFFHIKNLALKFLIENKITYLPLDVAKTLKNNNIIYSRYQNPYTKKFLETFNLWHLTKTDIGLMLKTDSQFFIFYDGSQKNFHDKRFTLAHEIGHIYLNHCDSNVYKNPSTEFEADLFAMNILAPTCILKSLNVTSYNDIIKITNLPKEYAKIIFNELSKNTNFNELENILCQQFNEWIGYRGNWQNAVQNKRS